MLRPYVVAAIAASAVASNLRQLVDEGTYDAEENLLTPYQYLDDYNDSEELASQPLYSNHPNYINNYSYDN